MDESYYIIYDLVIQNRMKLFEIQKSIKTFCLLLFKEKYTDKWLEKNKGKRCIQNMDQYKMITA